MPHDYKERLVLGRETGQSIITDEHLIRYELAKNYVKGKVVLDLACGSGYGSEILAKAGAAEVIAVDISEQAIEYAKKHFNQKNVIYQVGNAEKLNLADGSIDVIVSFETIEHLTEEHKYLAELKRALKPDGLVFISTPNREMSPGKNPFHEREYDKPEFENLLTRYFPGCRIFEQFNALASCVISCPEAPNKILLAKAPPPLYFLAVCSPAGGASSLELENIVSLNPRALDNLYHNPAVKLVNGFYALLIKIPGLKMLFKKIRS